jgi:hypothetical protein
MAKFAESQIHELREIMEGLKGCADVPQEMRELVEKTFADANRALLVELGPGPMRGGRTTDREKIRIRAVLRRAARRQLANRAREFEELVKTSPKYKNKEFTCIEDYDKCRRHRGGNSAFCAIAFLICIGRRIVPFMK